MTVKFMLEKMREAGCGVGPSFFQVETCSDLVGGGFRPPDGVRPPLPLLCAHKSRPTLPLPLASTQGGCVRRQPHGPLCKLHDALSQLKMDSTPPHSDLRPPWSMQRLASARRYHVALSAS